MNNVDILEEELRKDILYQIDMKLYDEFNDKFCEIEENLGTVYSYKDLEDLKKAESDTERTLLREAISTLIAKNKELKEEKEELKRENLEIRDWKYVIDSPIDLDKLKELDLIKIKGKEYISKSIYNELEKDKKALINNYSKILGEFIPKDKIKAKIEIRKEEKENCKDSIEEKYLLREIYVLQSLLGKE